MLLAECIPRSHSWGRRGSSSLVRKNTEPCATPCFRSRSLLAAFGKSGSMFADVLGPCDTESPTVGRELVWLLPKTGRCHGTCSRSALALLLPGCSLLYCPACVVTRLLPATFCLYPINSIHRYRTPGYMYPFGALPRQAGLTRCSPQHPRCETLTVPAVQVQP
jgi:hypothetical protein